MDLDQAEQFNETNGDTARMNTPLDQLKLRGKPTKATHPFLYKRSKICDITGSMITTSASTYTENPILKSSQELWEILEITDLHFLRKAEILSQL